MIKCRKRVNKIGYAANTFLEILTTGNFELPQMTVSPELLLPSLSD